jgi:putative hydrolase of the HAD superfamily
MPIRAVIFDIGDVLEHNPRTGWQRRWAQRAGLTDDDFERRLEPIWTQGSVGAITLADVESRTGELLRLDHVEVEELMEDVWEEYVGTLNREVADYFASLRPRYKTAILSNSFVGAREREQQRYGFEQMCDAIVYSHEVGCRKPDRRIYELVCERLAVAPEDALLLDDVQANVDGAREIGMQAIAFIDNAQAIAAVQAQLAG